MTLTSLITTTSNVIAFQNLYAKLCFGHVLKRSLFAHLMQVKLLLVIFI